MFSKQTKSATIASGAEAITPAPDTSLRRGPKIAGLIAEDLKIEGQISGDGELHVDGAIRGDVRVARLSVSETGDIEGSIEVEVLECRGRIVGVITAKQVRLYGAAHVEGDITHEVLTIEAGAFFQGRSLKLAPVAAQNVDSVIELQRNFAAE